MNGLGFLLLTTAMLLFLPWAAYKIHKAIERELQLQREEESQ